MPVDKKVKEALKEDLMEALLAASRESSTWTIMYHQAVAERAGLNNTDHKALDLLTRRGPMTAGQLAEITGLTTGAVTGVIDRLEKAGYAHRERDPDDRRRVIIQPDPEKATRALGPLFAHLSDRLGRAMQQYDADQLRLLLAYVEQSARFIQEEIDWLKSQGKA